MGPLPLTGVRVLDLTRVLAGPLCTMHLGDLGADVIKVERPGLGDDTREWGPPFDSSGESAYYLSVNRNKLSVALDLRLPGDLETVRALSRDAHVVVENFLPGALERLGWDIADELSANDQLIWCSITGFGPASTRPGYDFVVQAESGWMAITGETSGSPMKTGVALSDIVAGKDAAIAVLAALAGAGRDVHVNRHVVVSLADSARAALVNVAQNALVSGADAKRWGNAHPNLVPYQLFQAKDRPLVIAVGNEAQWLACVNGLGLSELAGDSEVETNRGRLTHRSRVVEVIQRAVAGRTADDCIGVLTVAGVPCGVVKSVLEAIADATDPSARTGMPSSVGGVTRRPPPRLNQHGAVVRRHGWSAFDVTE